MAGRPRKSELEKAIQNMADQTLKEISQIVHTEIREKYIDIINAFYADYPKPKKYIRSKYAYAASSGYKQLKPVKSGKKYYIAGITVNWQNVLDNDRYEDDYKADPEWVFQRTMYGIHGYTEYESRRWHLPFNAQGGQGQMDPKPSTELVKWWNSNYNSRKSHVKMEGYSKKTGRGGSLDELTNSIINKNIPKYLLDYLI